MEKALDAQRKAKNSIDMANKSIIGIEQDLKEVTSKADEAKGKTEEAKGKIVDLNDRLNNLTKKFTGNKFNIENAEKEAMAASSSAEDANKVR